MRFNSIAEGKLTAISTGQNRLSIGVQLSVSIAVPTLVVERFERALRPSRASSEFPCSLVALVSCIRCDSRSSCAGKAFAKAGWSFLVPSRSKECLSEVEVKSIAGRDDVGHWRGGIEDDTCRLAVHVHLAFGELKATWCDRVGVRKRDELSLGAARRRRNVKESATKCLSAASQVPQG